MADIAVKGKETFTMTFCDCGENHVGMQKIGEKGKTGYSPEKLKKIHEFFVEMGIESELVVLDEADGACVLVVRNACEFLCSGGGQEELFEEQKRAEYDRKALMRKKVVNKHARWNLCVGDEDQEPDMENGKGRVVSWKKMPLLEEVREYLEWIVGEEIDVAEGNYYFDTDKCYIGPHGDAERLKVIGIRLGATFPLFYQKYHKFGRVGKRVRIDLNGGDMYMMSQKATGNDWKKSSIETWRHAAGFKFIHDKNWK
jgi:hypothetical protein